MRLAASLVVRNELGRYLEPCIAHLREFCDVIVVLDDMSDDGTYEWLADRMDDQLVVRTTKEPSFYAHEGRIRQTLLDMTLAAKVTHVIALDADELVDDGAQVRRMLEREPDVPAWSLSVEEIWNARADGLDVREDGGWRSHPLAVLWRVPQHLDGSWRIADRKLASRRIPVAVQRLSARPTGAALMHFGWTDRATRQARYNRYVKHDGGRYHASRHLQSILWGDGRCTLRERPWPDASWTNRVKAKLVETVTA